MAVVVLGAEGFLGRHVVDALAEAGVPARPAPPIGQLDLRTAPPSAVADVLDSLGATAVVNATGQIAGSPAELMRGNAEVARLLVEACRLRRPGLRLVQLGSAAEYGPTPPGVPVREDVPERPVTDYGTAKLAASRAMLAAGAAGEVDPVVLRVFNPLGRGQSPMTLPGTVAAQLIADPTAELTVGALDGVRDFVSARDVGRAAVAAAVAERVPADARVVNVGSGSARSARDVVTLLRELGGHRGRLVETDGGSARSRAVDGAAADVERARRVLAWAPRDTFEEAVAAVFAGALVHARS
jgi:nucleoside-diphosphate-sugar epimerase